MKWLFKLFEPQATVETEALILENIRLKNRVEYLELAARQARRVLSHWYSEAVAGRANARTIIAGAFFEVSGSNYYTMPKPDRIRLTKKQVRRLRREISQVLSGAPCKPHGLRELDKLLERVYE